MSAAWASFDEELERWLAPHRPPPIWWRDDDATDVGPPLDRLLAAASEFDVPIALAVVPASATARLAARLAREPAHIQVLQHGYAHQNYAGPGERSIELGTHRPAMIVAGELATGWLALEKLFSERALAVLVPPWNRVDPRLLPILPEIGFRGLSTIGPRARVHPVRGLRQVNVHVDLIDWRTDRRFAGEDEVLGKLAAALAERRIALAAGAQDVEPIGVLTHHLIMDQPAWDFLQALFNRLKSARALSILAPNEAFYGEPSRVAPTQ